jgi:hypothetical protein
MMAINFILPLEPTRFTNRTDLTAMDVDVFIPAAGLVMPNY